MFGCKHRAGAPVASHRSVLHAQPLYDMNEPALDSAGQPFATDRAFYALACSDCDSESYADAASDSTGEDQEQRKDAQDRLHQYIFADAKRKQRLADTSLNAM